MTKQTQIIATEARIPLANLTLSPMNPRQDVPEADVIDLASSILEAGLIQSIAGLADAKGGAEIVAGGRRLRALHYLAEQHPDLETTHPELANPMVMLAPDRETAEAWASMENVARRDLHPAEEIQAYAKMEAAGAGVAAIARAFAVTEKHVYRRLALAHLPAPVIEALKSGDVSLSGAAAFTISEDETVTLEVLERVKGHAYSDSQIKRMLKPDSIKDSDRRAVFVGEDAYKAAGGTLGGDLFAETTLFDSPEILDGCFAVALEDAAREVAEAQGWNWVAAISEHYVCSYGMGLEKYGRVYREEGELSEAQAERYDALAEPAEYGELSDEDAAEFEALQAILDGDYTETQKAHAGVFVYVDHAGVLQVSAGWVKPEDRSAAIEAGVLAKSHHGSSTDTPKEKPAISAKLADDLSRVVTGARQHAALNDPDLLIDLLAYQLSHALNWNSPLGITTTEVPNWPTTEAEGYALDDRLTSNPPRDMWQVKDLAASFRAFRKKGPEHVKGELTRFLAAALQGGDEKLAALVSKETKTDIRAVWTPNAANFFGRVAGPYLNTLWRDLLDLAEDHPTATTFAKLKKAEKVAKLDALFNDPETRAALKLTEAQEARIAEWLPEGMG